MELLGAMPMDVARSGKYAKDLFDRKGNLRNIRELRYWYAWTTLRSRLLSTCGLAYLACSWRQSQRAERSASVLSLCSYIPTDQCALHPFCGQGLEELAHPEVRLHRR
eukprot:COSAG02_NODE_1715_length_11211_cov_8.483801_5_plen_108_part_00